MVLSSGYKFTHFPCFHQIIGKKNALRHMQLPKRNSFEEMCMLFLGGLTVAAHELINTSSGVDELALTCVERVR